MLLGKPFEQFVEESPISVMMRGIVEYAFEAKRLDDIFEDTAETQYTRTLRFSTIADLMSEVVFDISPSIGAAYAADGLSCPVATLARAWAVSPVPTLWRAWLRLDADISNRPRYIRPTLAR